MSIDYKKIIKSRSMRLKLLRLLNFIPDKLMLKLQYRIKIGVKLNLKNPKRFTEKLQWYKLYYKDPKMIQCVDKYDVREYVKQKGLENILIPCYGVYDSVEEIDWEVLPNQFVMKDTLGGGGVSVVIVKDKKTADINQLKEKAKEWTSVKAHQKDAGREWPYYSGKNHRILFEKYIESDESAGGLADYKFFCFNGKVVVVYVIADRVLSEGAGLGIYTSNFERLPVNRLDERILERTISTPENYEELKKVAERLSEDFPEVRIDLYDENGKIVFGEMTFFDGSGYMKFSPDQFDFDLGDAFVLPPVKQRGGGKMGCIKLRLQNSNGEKGLLDYKFFCFNGRVEFIYVMGERSIGNKVSVAIYNRDFSRLDVQRIGDSVLTDIHRPNNFLEMRRIAEILSKDFPHVRVDLYDNNEQINFGELTFYNASGYMKYSPDQFDYIMGELFKLPRRLK